MIWTYMNSSSLLFIQNSSLSTILRDLRRSEMEELERIEDEEAR